MVNKVILIGRVGKDPEIRHIDSNTAVASFSLATNETYLKDGQRVELTEWHNIVAWRNFAKLCEDYVRKGTLLYIEGRLRTRNYDKDGSKHYITEIVTDAMRLLTPKDSSSAQPAAPSVPSVESTAIPDAAPADDLPF